MKYPKLRELREAVRALIRGPYTSRFPYEPHKPYARFRSRPYFHEEDCTGCTACAQVCPSRAIDVEEELTRQKARRKLTVHWDLCIFCGQCQANCLTGKGIILSQEFDFATTGKREELKNSVEKELLLCECCREPVVPEAQYNWVAKKLGPLTFTNASLMYFYLKSLALALKSPAGADKSLELARVDRVKILCPRCRREAVLKS